MISKKNITIAEMKKCELEMLLFIDEICNRHGLRYYLAYGTLLGAVRHKGFIPWDDDVDVAMPRNDFIKLCRLLPSNTPYALVSSYTTKGYTVPFAKLYDKRTELKQNYSFLERVELGVYIDIFILDGFPTSSSLARIHSEKINKYMKGWYWANTKFRVSNSLLRDSVRFVLTIPCRIKGAIFYSELLNNTLSVYDFDESVLVSDASSMDPLSKCTMLKDVYGEGTLLEFEGHMFSAPQKYDDYLRINYGDYMRIPDEKDRVSNHNYVAYWRD